MCGAELIFFVFCKACMNTIFSVHIHFPIAAPVVNKEQICNCLESYSGPAHRVHTGFTWGTPDVTHSYSNFFPFRPLRCCSFAQISLNPPDNVYISIQSA